MPGDASLQDEENPGQDCAVGKTWSAAPGSAVLRQEGFDDRPKVVGDSGYVHLGRLRAAHYCSALLDGGGQEDVILGVRGHATLVIGSGPPRLIRSNLEVKQG